MSKKSRALKYISRGLLACIAPAMVYFIVNATAKNFAPAALVGMFEFEVLCLIMGTWLKRVYFLAQRLGRSQR